MKCTSFFPSMEKHLIPKNCCFSIKNNKKRVGNTFIDLILSLEKAFHFAIIPKSSAPLLPPSFKCSGSASETTNDRLNQQNPGSSLTF